MRMDTPLVTNWRKVDASKGEQVDPTIYRQLIGSLMFLVNTWSDICFTDNQLSEFMVEPTKVHWVVAKLCSDTSEVHQTMIVVQIGWWSEAWGLQKCRLGKELHKQEEYFKWHLQHWVSNSFLVQQFLSTTGNKKQLHSVQQRLSTWFLVKQLVRLFGWGSYLWDFSDKGWSLPW